MPLWLKVADDKREDKRRRRRKKWIETTQEQEKRESEVSVANALAAKSLERKRDNREQLVKKLKKKEKK